MCIVHRNSKSRLKLIIFWVNDVTAKFGLVLPILFAILALAIAEGVAITGDHHERPRAKLAMLQADKVNQDRSGSIKVRLVTGTRLLVSDHNRQFASSGCYVDIISCMLISLWHPLL